MSDMYGTETNMPCPSCGGKMFGSAYEDNPTMKKFGLSLKEKSSNICTECGTEIDMVQWKKEVFTI